jgi:hypothetical protein
MEDPVYVLDYTGNDDRNALFHFDVWDSVDIHDTFPLLLDNGKG